MNLSNRSFQVTGTCLLFTFADVSEYENADADIWLPSTNLCISEMIYEDIFLDMVMLDISSVSLKRMMRNTFKFRQSFKNFLLQS
jgi:hypothetical protein